MIVVKSRWLLAKGSNTYFLVFVASVDFELTQTSYLCMGSVEHCPELLQPMAKVHS